MTHTLHTRRGSQSLAPRFCTKTLWEQRSNTRDFTSKLTSAPELREGLRASALPKKRARGSCEDPTTLTGPCISDEADPPPRSALAAHVPQQSPPRAQNSHRHHRDGGTVTDSDLCHLSMAQDLPDLHLVTWDRHPVRTESS